ncbi:MAG: ferrochelatase [Vulcanimicrobiota bacterium]
MSRLPYDALLVVSFGGPEQPEDVIPFLENVTRGRGVPRERLESVAEHYYHFGGKSPINDQNRALIDALRVELSSQGLEMPIYFGNRNWHPMLADTLKAMAADGVKRALAFFTSAFSSYSGCRQYRENILAAQQQVGPTAPEIDKLRGFWNHPGFLEPLADSLGQVCRELEPARTAVIFTAHSIPSSMAENCRYEQQLLEASELVAQMAGVASWELNYQSRSGSPHTPWLEPDVCDRIRELAAEGKTDVVILPIGFISDHMEVLYDLDTEALELCEELGMRLHRLPTVGTHPRFVSMIVELLKERCGLQEQRRCLGRSGPNPDVCPSNCCLSGAPHRQG